MTKIKSGYVLGFGLMFILLKTIRLFFSRARLKIWAWSLYTRGKCLRPIVYSLGNQKSELCSGDERLRNPCHISKEGSKRVYMRHCNRSFSYWISIKQTKEEVCIYIGIGYAILSCPIKILKKVILQIHRLPSSDSLV